MRDYKIQLAAAGSLTQLPDSQKLFGALVCMFSEKYGSEKASMLTRALLDKKIHLALSNVMPLDYLPMPQDYLIGGNIGDNNKSKKKRKAIKERSYIRLAELDHILQMPEECENVYPYIKLQNRQQLRASIESERYGIPELNSKLYSVPTVDLWEVSGDKESKKPVTAFNFYMQADDSELCADLLEVLKEAASTNQTVILGKRASQGLNIFGFQDIIEQDLPCTPEKHFLNMGMLLPDKINFKSSTLKLFTSERRPFEMAGGWDKDYSGHFISFIAQGSIISAPGGSADAGRSIQSPFNKKRDIVFGNAFLYPISLQGRRV